MKSWQALRAERSGILSIFPPNEHLAIEASDADFEARMNERWEYGGFGFYRSYIDIVVDPQSNERAVDYVRGQIASKVHDPDTAALLSLQHNCCKRPCLDTSTTRPLTPNTCILSTSPNRIQHHSYRCKRQ